MGVSALRRTQYEHFRLQIVVNILLLYYVNVNEAVLYHGIGFVMKDDIDSLLTTTR